MQRSSTLTMVSTAALMLALTACSGTQTRFYTLTSFASDVAKPASAATPMAMSNMQNQTFIEVLPVNVPERLARPQIVLRSGDTRIDILEQDRWSAPFNNELRDALASRIANRLGAVDVTRGGRPAYLPVYRIAVELRQIDAVRGKNVQEDKVDAAKGGDAGAGAGGGAAKADAAAAGKVDASFSWTVTRSDNANSAVCFLTVVTPTKGGSVDSVVQGMQRAVATVGDAIAADVATLRDGRNGVCNN